jgi:hypothetical protein
MASRIEVGRATRAGSQFRDDSFQRGLATWNRSRLMPGYGDDDWRSAFDRDIPMLRLEAAFLEDLISEVAQEASEVPTDAAGFIEWFESLKEAGPGQGDPLFPWLSEDATRDQLRWFFEQEAAGEAGFDDLVAMTQVKLPVRTKLELARNYWDEMGRGTAAGMHGPMLDALVATLEVNPAIDTTVWESLCLANAMTAMATARRHAWRSVGALGVVELTAPSRVSLVAQGLHRVGLSKRESRYFDLHASLDVHHSIAWNKEAITPAVTEDPTRAVAMAEGALVRLRCGARCFDRYRSILWS